MMQKKRTFWVLHDCLKMRICLILWVFISFGYTCRRSRGKRKNGNLKCKHKNRTFWTLADLCKILKSVRHQMLSKLYSLSIVSLRKLDEEANKFYDRKHDFYQTAFLLDVTLNMLFDHTLSQK